MEGERIALRDLAPGDVAPYLQAFADDPDLAATIGMEEAPSTAAARRMVRREPHARDAGERARFAVARLTDDAFAGVMGLHNLEWAHRRAECGFFVVPAARRGGLALEALRLLVGWAFATLGLTRVGMMTLPENLAAQALAERAGFAREGVLRAYTLERGRRVDNVVFGAIAGDAAWA
ncbi:MAG: GNAT family N-acetyltransferase [Solirubrobacteraceae bacterium]